MIAGIFNTALQEIFEGGLHNHLPRIPATST